MPAIVETVYTAPLGINIRIVLFALSQIYKFPDISTVIPAGLLNAASKPGPSLEPGFPA